MHRSLGSRPPSCTSSGRARSPFAPVCPLSRPVVPRRLTCRATVSIHLGMPHQSLIHLGIPSPAGAIISSAASSRFGTWAGAHVHTPRLKLSWLAIAICPRRPRPGSRDARSLALVRSSRSIVAAATASQQQAAATTAGRMRSHAAGATYRRVRLGRISVDSALPNGPAATHGRRCAASREDEA
jgi:hypothetical protein